MRSVRKWISYLLITVMVMMAGGCAEKGSSESETGEALPNESQGKNYSLGVYQDGFAVLSGNGMMTIYLDEDHSYRPLCLKPECSHELEDKTCQAVLLAEESGGWIRYHEGHLWFIPFSLGEDSYLYQTDLWGDNLKKISQVMAGVSYTPPVLFREGKMIRVVWNFTQDENLLPSGVDAWITEIDLETGGETVLAGPVHGRSSNLFLEGGYGDIIYYKVNAESEVGERPDAALIAINRVTGEQQTVIANVKVMQVCGICQQWLYVQEQGADGEKIRQYNLNDFTDKLLEMPEGEDAFRTFDVYLMEDHLLMENERGEWWRYDPEKETMELYRTPMTDDGFTPSYQTETGYLGVVTRLGTETIPTMSQEYAFLSFEEFQDGKEPLLLSHNDKKPFSIE